MGDPKQLDTPTAHAAASISVFRDSFYKTKCKLSYFCDAKHVNNAYFLTVENEVLTVYIPLNDATNFPMDRATMLAI